MDTVRISEIARNSHSSLTEEQFRCHEVAVRCAEFLRKENFEVVVRHGAALYHIPFLADKIAETGGEFGQMIGKLLRSHKGPSYYLVSHSWCEVGSVVVDCLPNIKLVGIQCSGPLIVCQKSELKDSDVRYIPRGFEFSLSKIRFLIVPNFAFWKWIIPFRLVKLAI